MHVRMQVAGSSDLCLHRTLQAVQERKHADSAEGVATAASRQNRRVLANMESLDRFRVWCNLVDMAESENKAPDWVKALPPTSDLVIGTAHGVLVRIKPDGRLEYGAEYEPDEAARLFWQAMARQREHYEEQRLISQHVEAVVARLGAADIYCEAMRVEAASLAGSGREGAVVLEAQRATSVLARINDQVIELGRGLAERAADVKFVDVPHQVPKTIAQDPSSNYEPKALPDDEEIGPRKPQGSMN